MEYVKWMLKHGTRSSVVVWFLSVICGWITFTGSIIWGLVVCYQNWVNHFTALNNSIPIVEMVICLFLGFSIIFYQITDHHLYYYGYVDSPEYAEQLKHLIKTN